jgi:hypothetical protein
MGRTHFRRPFLFIGVVSRLRFVLDVPVRLEAFDLWNECVRQRLLYLREAEQGTTARMA